MFPLVGGELVVKVVAATAVAILALFMGAFAVLGALGIAKDDVRGFIAIFGVVMIILSIVGHGR